MKKTLLTTLFALSVCAPLAAQATRRTQPPAAARPAATPARTPAATQAPPPGAQEGPAPAGLPEVLAVVNGIKITSREIEEPIRKQVEEYQQQVVEARKRELDLQINSILLEAEAKKRGVETSKLLEQEIVAKVVAPTDAEARQFYNENKQRVDQQAGRATTFEELKPRIVEYLREQKNRAEAKSFADRLRAASDVKMHVAEATPPATAADRARVLATVNGKQITSAMIEDSLKPLAYSSERAVYNLRRQQLDMRVNDVLLTQEAQKRQVTPNALLQSEVNAKLKPATEAEAQAFYNENKERINGDFASVRQQIIDYLGEQQQGALTNELAKRLRAAAALQQFLAEPAVPVFEVATDDQPSKGPAAAPVTLVEFTDFQCPTCAAFQPVLDRLLKEYPEQLRVVVRDYPLVQHTEAPKAAEAAEAARAQGRYWEYAALLFANQSALEVPKLREYALRAGLDVAKFDAALGSGQHAGQVSRDVNDGNRLGVNSTPYFFVNGRPVEERSYEGLKAAIDAALRARGRD